MQLRPFPRARMMALQSGVCHREDWERLREELYLERADKLLGNRALRIAVLKLCREVRKALWD